MAKGGVEGLDAPALRAEVERALAAMDEVRRIKLHLTNAAGGIEQARAVLDGMAERVRAHLGAIDALRGRGRDRATVEAVSRARNASCCADGLRPEAVQPLARDLDPEDRRERRGELVAVGDDVLGVDRRADRRQRSRAQRDDPVGHRLLDDERLHEGRLRGGRQAAVVLLEVGDERRLGGCMRKPLKELHSCWVIHQVPASSRVSP